MSSIEARVRRVRGAVAASACLACAAILCALWATPRADAAWSPPTTIANTHGAGFTQVAMDSAGDTVFAWQQGTADLAEMDTRTRMADGSLTRVQRIAGPEQVGGSADFAVDPAGNAYYVWQSTNFESTSNAFQIRARVRFADGTLGPLLTLARAKGSDFLGDPAVGVSSTGRAVFSWRRRNGDNPALIQARSRSASGQLGPVRTIARPDLVQAQMAVDGSGNATFAWEARPGGGRPEIFTRILASNGGLTATKQVSRSGRGAGGPNVGVSRKGRAVFEWQENDPDGSHPVIMVRGRTADGNLQAPQLLASANTANLDMATAPDGAAVVCWIGSDSALRARSRTAGGTLGPLLTVAAAPSNPGLCHPGIGSNGTVAFAWTDSDASKQRVNARSGDVGGPLSPTQTLSPAGFNANFPALTVGSDGVVPVAWVAGKRGFAVQAAFGP